MTAPLLPGDRDDRRWGPISNGAAFAPAERFLAQTPSLAGLPERAGPDGRTPIAERWRPSASSWSPRRRAWPGCFTWLAAVARPGRPDAAPALGLYGFRPASSSSTDLCGVDRPAAGRAGPAVAWIDRWLIDGLVDLVGAVPLGVGRMLRPCKAACSSSTPWRWCWALGCCRGRCLLVEVRTRESTGRVLRKLDEIPAAGDPVAFRWPGQSWPGAAVRLAAGSPRWPASRPSPGGGAGRRVSRRDR